MGIVRLSLTALATLLVVPAAVSQELPDWAAKIRSDHPRLFFNADTWPAVKARALGEESKWYEALKARVDKLHTEIGDVETPEPRELGPQAAWAAFVYLVTEDDKYLDLARRALETSLRFYEQCYEQRKAVNWYSTSRVHATLAWDWLYNALPEEERRSYMDRLVTVLHKVYTAKPAIYRESLSRYSTGFYGVTNCKWFVGCTALGTGIQEQLTEEWLVWGYDENHRMLQHRKDACGDDGGSASPTLGYAFGAYPWAEQNFFYTWLSATGENIAPQWPHSAWLANYVLWNWIATEGSPLEFGYGDTPHTTNVLHSSSLYTHMANVRHLFGGVAPEAAALARHVQDLPPNQNYTMDWFIYPFLLTNLDIAAEPFRPTDLPHARHFDNMGQIFMRSGDGAEDTYALFTCGGTLAQHRHYDALNFVIYHRGHLALDTGTRYEEVENGQHLANYFAQSVAHNVVLVHQPGEPPARYWGGTVESNYGGQHRQLGSVVKAFETTGEYVYVAGDGTPCYLHGGVKREGEPDLPEKVTEVTRQYLFILPNHFVVLDRVTTTDPAYRKDWLLHTAHEPLIDGALVQADHVAGRMLCRTLLPEDAAIGKVGGPGNEFRTGDVNWDINRGNLKPENLAMMGQWRVEVTPGSARAEDLFLHVIQVGDQSLEEMDPVCLIREDGRVGARIVTDGRTVEALFDTSGPLGGHLRIGGEGPAVDRELTGQVTPQVGILATPE